MTKTLNDNNDKLLSRKFAFNDMKLLDLILNIIETMIW